MTQTRETTIVTRIDMDRVEDAKYVLAKFLGILATLPAKARPAVVNLLTVVFSDKANIDLNDIVEMLYDLHDLAEIGLCQKNTHPDSVIDWTNATGMEIVSDKYDNLIAGQRNSNIFGRILKTQKSGYAYVKEMIGD
jgi:hypothetical protein